MARPFPTKNPDKENFDSCYFSEEFSARTLKDDCSSDKKECSGNLWKEAKLEPTICSEKCLPEQNETAAETEDALERILHDSKDNNEGTEEESKRLTIKENACTVKPISYTKDEECLLKKEAWVNNAKDKIQGAPPKIKTFISPSQFRKVKSLEQLKKSSSTKTLDALAKDLTAISCMDKIVKKKYKIELKKKSKTIEALMKEIQGIRNSLKIANENNNITLSDKLMLVMEHKFTSMTEDIVIKRKEQSQAQTIERHAGESAECKCLCFCGKNKTQQKFEDPMLKMLPDFTKRNTEKFQKLFPS